jgi:hypothetical protein
MDSHIPALDHDKAMGFIELWTQGVSAQTIAKFLGDDAAPVDEIAALLALPPRTKRRGKKVSPPAPEPESLEAKQARELQTLLRTEGKYAALAEWAAAQTPPLTLIQATQRWHRARAGAK